MLWPVNHLVGNNEIDILCNLKDNAKKIQRIFVAVFSLDIIIASILHTVFRETYTASYTESLDTAA